MRRGEHPARLIACVLSLYQSHRLCADRSELRATLSILEADAPDLAIYQFAAKRQCLHSTQSRHEQQAYCCQGTRIFSSRFGISHRLPELADLFEVEETPLLSVWRLFQPARGIFL